MRWPRTGPAAAQNAAREQADPGRASARAHAFPRRGPGVVGLGPRWLVALSTPVGTAPSGRGALHHSATATPRPTPLRPSEEPGCPVTTRRVDPTAPPMRGAGGAATSEQTLSESALRLPPTPPQPPKPRAALCFMATRTTPKGNQGWGHTFPRRGPAPCGERRGQACRTETRTVRRAPGGGTGAPGGCRLRLGFPLVRSARAPPA